MAERKGYIGVTRGYEDAAGNVTGETELRVHYLFRAGHSGCMYLRNGDPGFPPEDDEIELDYVQRERWVDGKPVWVLVTPQDDADDLIEWAEAYLESHAAEVAEDVSDRDQEAREYAAGLRADR